MPQLESSVLINAPIETCYEICSSFDQLVAFTQLAQPGIQFEVTPDAKGQSFQKGVTYSIESKNSPISFRMIVRLEKERAPNLLVISGEQIMQSHYKMRYELQDERAQTRLKMQFEFEPADGLLSKLFAPVAVPLQRAALARWGDFMKRTAESTTGEGFIQMPRKQSIASEERSTNTSVEIQATSETVSKHLVSASNQGTEGVSFKLIFILIAIVTGVYFYY